MPEMIARWKARAGAALGTFWRSVRPEPVSWKGAGRLALLAGSLVYLAWLLAGHTGPLGLRLPAVLFYAALGALAVLGMQLVSLVIGWLDRIPFDTRWQFLGGVFLIVATVFSLKREAAVVAALAIALSAALLGAGLWQLRYGDPQARPRRAAAMVGALLGTVLLLSALGWWVSPGAAPQAQPSAAAVGAPLASVTLENPALAGPFAVEQLTYGSGTDRFRPEYGTQASLITTPVDGSRLLSGTWTGLSGSVRPLLWGFDRGALPLNGRVWYPQAAAGGGPFPLVVAVHGNHAMQDFSDPGYAYLGELLASRGFIFISIDQNFLNGGFLNLFDPTRSENDARAWLMLEHLRVWHDWNQDPANPFYGLVDTDRIALVGHSRGGEAAALASAFNRLPAFPEDARQSFDYGYQVRSVVAIAPIDGQYWPADRGTRLEDVSYLVVHGSYDADVYSFDGLNQYERVRFSQENGGFKAAVYIHRANHGQFNEVWGDRDQPAFVSSFLNRRALLAAGEQRQAASVYISAFLEASLNGQTGYLPLFQDARAAPAGWLPETIYLNRLGTPGDQIIAGYEEDINLRTASVAGGQIEGAGLSTWSERRIPLRWGGGETAVVQLSWNEQQPARYAILLPENAPALEATTQFIFSMADASGPKAPREPVDLTIAVQDAAGQEARLPLSTRMPVQPQLLADVWKLPFFARSTPSEAVLQDYAFALSEFSAQNPAIDFTRLRAVRFLFDRTASGSLYLDAVGFRPVQPATPGERP